MCDCGLGLGLSESFSELGVVPLENNVVGHEGVEDELYVWMGEAGIVELS
jgi:hypothetical protein